MSRRLSGFNPFAVVEVVRAPGGKGIAPGAGQDDPDPDWQPL
jgi:hypothetical protein